MVRVTWRLCRDPQSDMSSFTHEENETIQINAKHEQGESTWNCQETRAATDRGKIKFLNKKKKKIAANKA